jgi:hypothetical protein
MAKQKDNNNKLAVVSNLADARKRKSKAEATSPLEAFPPMAVKLQGDDWQITGCDGEQVYVWTAIKKTKRSKTFTVTEVYPGLQKKRTDLRDASEAADLVLDSKCSKLDDIIEDLEETLFEGFAEEDDGTAG